MKIFVSYSHPEGLEFAKMASSQLLAAGEDPWNWDDDRHLGRGVWSQIAERIVNSELVISIVTSGSTTSKGQLR